MAAIEKCDADFADAGELKGACEEILDAMKRAKDMSSFGKELTVLSASNCSCTEDLFDAAKKGCCGCC